MEYHKIETLYERDLQTFKVNPKILKNPTYGLLKQWEFTEKIDGMNIRIIWENGKLSFAGRTNKANLPEDLVNYLCTSIDARKMNEVFPETNVIIYGEGYGAGIQKGGFYSPTKKFIAFDVLVENKWWLNWENLNNVTKKLEIDVVPYIGLMSLEDATEMVKSGFRTSLGNADSLSEGLVGRPQETLFDKNGKRLILKLKTRDF